MVGACNWLEQWQLEVAEFVLVIGVLDNRVIGVDGTALGGCWIVLGRHWLR